MEDERDPTETSEEPVPSEGSGNAKTFEVRRRTVGIVVSTVAAACLLGLGGYLVGRNGGEDLEKARAEGSRVGNKIGAIKGSAKGYAVGLKQGERKGYRDNFGSAYRKAYSEAMANAGLDRPALQSIQLPGE